MENGAMFVIEDPAHQLPAFRTMENHAEALAGMAALPVSTMK